MKRIELSKTFLALNQLSKNVIRDSRRNLAKRTTRITGSGRRVTSKIDNSGALSRSIKSTITKGSVTFEMEDYGEYVDEGRLPGKWAPVDKIREWVRSKPIKPRDKDGRFMKIRPSTMNSLAFLLNRAIKDNGIPATNFFTDPLEAEFEKLKKKIPKTLEADLDTFFKK